MTNVRLGDINVLRKAIGDGVFLAQHQMAARGYSAEEVVPEIVDALVSLAAYVAKNNCYIPPRLFLAICETRANEEWEQSASPDSGGDAKL